MESVKINNLIRNQSSLTQNSVEFSQNQAIYKRLFEMYSDETMFN